MADSAIDTKVTSYKIGLAEYRSTTVNSSIETVKSVESNVYGWNALNPNSSDVYLKFYDVNGGATVGTDSPVRTVIVPAGGQAGHSVTDLPDFHCDDRLEIAATANLADSDTTDPTSDITVELQYAYSG